MTKTAQDDIAFIRALAELLRDTDLAELEVNREYGEDDELRVRLTRPSAAAPVAAAPSFAPAPAPAPQAPAAPEPSLVAASADPTEHPGAVVSPMVGTVYFSPAPDADPFVKVGDRVAEGQTLLIVEAMKTMNQIAAPRAGTVRRVLVEDKQPVEYGAPLMIIE